MRAQVIDGTAISTRMRAETRPQAQAQAMAETGWMPRLIPVSVGDTAASEIYVRKQGRAAEQAGVAFEARAYPGDISLEQLTGVLCGVGPVTVSVLMQKAVLATGMQMEHYRAAYTGAAQ